MTYYKKLNPCETRYFPQTHILKLHAKKISKQFSISLCQAQEMLAFYYECENWSELKHCANNSVTYRRNISVSGGCNQEARHLRQILDEHLRTGELDVNSLRDLKLQPDTIAHYLYNRELHKLFDDEIIHLYYVIYENQTAPLHDPASVIISWNNCASSLFLWRGVSRQWMYDYRYGTKLYCNDVQIQKKRVFVIREFDCYFYPPHYSDLSLKVDCNSTRRSFGFMRRKDWYPKYALSYFSKVAADLALHTTFDAVAIHRLDNIDLFDRKHGITPIEGANKVAKSLIDKGATTLEFFGDGDGRIGLCIDLNNIRLLLNRELNGRLTFLDQ